MTTTPHTRPSAVLVFTAITLAAPVHAQTGPQPEETVYVNMLDNGAFDVPRAPRGSPLAERIPWWRGPATSKALKRKGDQYWLKIDGPELFLEQPIPVYAPLMQDVIVRGYCQGYWSEVSVVDGRGDVATLALPEQFTPGKAKAGATPQEFQFSLAEFGEALGRPLEPRIALRLPPIVQGDRLVADKSYWQGLKVLVPLPLPTEAALRREVVTRLDEIFTTWIERGLDREGPRETGFLCVAFDVVTGERITTISGSWQPFWQYMLLALEVHDDPEWRAAFDAFVRDYLELGLHPETGLPRKWDCVRDEPLDREVSPVVADLEFLLDLHEHGAEAWRQRALDAAVKMGGTILARGVLPDGSIAPRYTPADGTPNTDEPPHRRLTLPAQLARLGALADDARFTDAARRALAEAEFTHHWGGTWDSIDPDLDDRFGFLGAASVVMHTAHPEDPSFGRLAATGWEHFEPIWRDALQYGGSIAADQVRCWELMVEYARVRPEIRGDVALLLKDAVRAHLRGEQLPSGAWGDVTHENFDPKTDLEVGDLPGAPANLLWGLGLLYERELGLPDRIMRGLFTAVLRSTVEHYGRDFGYLSTPTQLAGTNAPGAGHRLAKGLVTMLHNLPR
jgi:hypothetical protein